MFSIQVTGIDALRKELEQFSDRRLNAAVATAMTRTVKRLAEGWQGQINREIDRPTARTMRAVGFAGAQAARLEARVFVKDAMAGTTPAEYLIQHEMGGARRIKKFEQALISSGAMPAGYVTVPGRHAAIDGYGNVSRSLIVAVIAQLGADYSPGYQRVISKSTEKRLARQKRLGRTFIAVSPDQAKRFNLNPGIYERMADGSRKAVFLYQRGTSYRRRLGLMDSGKRDAGAMVQQEFSRAVGESLARLQARDAR